MIDLNAPHAWQFQMHAEEDGTAVLTAVCSRCGEIRYEEWSRYSKKFDLSGACLAHEDK